jgi:hypothetical protein
MTLSLLSRLFGRAGLLMAAVPVLATVLAAPAADSPRGAGAGWQVGYWAWRTSYQPIAPQAAGEQGVDLLYVDAGEFRTDLKDGQVPAVHLVLPDKLPRAGGYLAVVRLGGTVSPPGALVATLVAGYRSLQLEATRRGCRLIGLQLDYDCPTRRLVDYARFLGELRTALHGDGLLSITALLDWFRPGSAVARVINQVDEYVPQFYDVAPLRGAREDAGVARAIGPSWGRVFNALGKPYRVGIASFGRIVAVSRDTQRRTCGDKPPRVQILDDPPLELLARNRLHPLGTTTTPAGETLARYRLDTPGKYLTSCSARGDEIRMIIPTRRSVASAYAAARAMGGWCRGVVFFRWPLVNEAMVLSRSEVEGIIAGRGEADAVLESEDGYCAAVQCRDLYLRLGDRFPAGPVTYRVHVSRELEYFLPEELLRTTVSGTRTLEVTVPAHAGVPRLFLGRAVTLEPAEYDLERMKR